MKFPVAQWAHFLVSIPPSVNPFPCSLPLPSTAFIQIRATLVPAHVCTCIVHARTTSSFPPLSFPPPPTFTLTRKQTTAQGTWKEIWILVRACFGILTCLPVLSCPPVTNLLLPAVLITAEYESCSRLCMYVCTRLARK